LKKRMPQRQENASAATSLQFRLKPSGDIDTSMLCEYST
jgi:hypothetical protein